MDLKRWIVLLSIITFCFSAFKATDAQVLESSIVVFDQLTLQKGYTVKSVDQNLWLPIFPNQYKEKLTVKITEEDNFDQLPDGYKAISDFYVFDVRTSEPGFLAEPVTVSIGYDSSSILEKAIYFYDNSQAKWRILPSNCEHADKRLRARSIFPYLKVVVLEKEPGELTAQSAIVIDKDSGKVVFGKNVDEVRSIASLTKLTTVLVFLDHNPGWDKDVTMKESDFVGGVTLWVKAGDQITVKDLFYSVLVGSKNNAVEALIRSTGLSRDEFITGMNLKVQVMGLNKTKFFDPTGLDERNVSTASELAVIAKYAFNNPEVFKATTMTWYQVKPLNNDLSYWVKNTSEKVLSRDLEITGTKTGWTDEAGYCLVSQAKNLNHEMLALVMGAKISQNYEEVYQLLKKYL